MSLLALTKSAPVSPETRRNVVTSSASLMVVVRSPRRQTSTAARRFDCSDVDLFHLHHGIERALGGRAIGIGDRFRQRDWRDLPGQSPFVRAPTARALLATVADNRVPIAIRFRLISRCDLERERFSVLERRSPVD